ncbi:MAG: pyridoxamine 5'-phosphate oxidase family protein [Dehalococcoidia bacterium]
MAITLDQQEIDEFLTNGHTVIFTCLDKNGYPHSTPLWYVYMDGHIVVRGRTGSQKQRNLQRDSRVSVLVESGERWRDLKAVMIRGRAEPVEDEETQARYDRLMDEKYEPFRERRGSMPDRVKAHYSVGKVYYRVVPKKKLATWDNQKIRMVAR